MLLVVDANVVFSALIREGSTLRLLEFNSIFKIIELVAPEFLWDEIEEHKEEIIKKSKLSEEELEKVLGFIMSEIKAIPDISLVDNTSTLPSKISLSFLSLDHILASNPKLFNFKAKATYGKSSSGEISLVSSKNSEKYSSERLKIKP